MRPRVTAGVPRSGVGVGWSRRTLAGVAPQLVLLGVLLIAIHTVRKAMTCVGGNGSSAPQTEFVTGMARDQRVVECLSNPTHSDRFPPC
jgi:hypothetical protein